METAIEEQITQEDISTFQQKIGQFFIHQLRDNITSRFTSSDVVRSFSIFDPRKVPATSSPLFSLYGEDAIDTLIDHKTSSLKMYMVFIFVKERIIFLDVHTEWKTYCQLLSKQPKDNLKTQLQELATNDTLIALLPNLHKLACCCLSLPIGTTSVERSFSQMKIIKTRLRNRLGELSLSAYYCITVLLTCSVLLLTCSVLLLTCSVLLLTCSVLLLTCSVLLLTCSVLLLTCSVLLLTCSVLLLTCSVLLLLTCSVLLLTCSVLLLTYSVLLLTCSVLLLTCSVLLLTCSVLLLTCSVLLLTCSVLLLTCSVLLLTYSVLLTLGCACAQRGLL